MTKKEKHGCGFREYPWLLFSFCIYFILILLIGSPMKLQRRGYF
jgi:hypothetical protein